MDSNYENILLPRLMMDLETINFLQSKQHELNVKLQSIKMVVSKIQFQNPLAYKATLIILLKNFSQPSKEVLKSVDATSLALIIEIIAVIHRNQSNACSKEIYSTKNLNSLSQATYFIVQTLSCRSEKIVKLAALNCLSDVFRLDRELSSIDVDQVLELQMRYTLYQITPKVFAILFQEIEHRGLHSTTETIAKAAEVLVLLCNKLFSKDSTTNITNNVVPADNVTGFLKWLPIAVKKLSPHIQLLRYFLADIDENMLILKTLASTGLVFLNNCPEYMQEISYVFVDIVLALTRLKIVSESDLVFPQDIKLPELKQRLEGLLERLPSFLYAKNEKKFIISLNISLAYIDFILKNQNELLTDPFFIEKIITTLVTLMKLKLKTQTVENRRTETITMDMEASLHSQYYAYKDLHNANVEKLVESVLTTLSSNILFKFTIDVLFDHISSNHSNEITLMFIHIFKSDKDIPQEFTEQCLEEYLDDKHWYIETNLTDSSNKDNEQIVLNTIHIILTMELLSILLKRPFCGNDIFEKRLYLKLFEKLDNPNSYISNSALITIKSISSHESFKVYSRSLLPVIVASGKLNQNGSFIVLNVILQFLDTSNDSILIFEIIERAIRFITDANEPDRYSLIKTIYLALKKICQKQSVSPQLLKKFSKEEFIDSWTQFDVEDRTEEIQNEEIGDAEDECVDEEPEKEQPLSEKVYKKIILNLADIITSSNINMKIMAIRSVDLCFKELEEESNILQSVHKIWPFIVLNLKTRDDIILNETYNLLVTVTNRSKSFVQQRLETDIIPTLLASVRFQAEKITQIPQTSQKYKLEIRLIDMIVSIIRDTEVSEGALNSLLDTLMSIEIVDQSERNKHFIAALRSIYNLDRTSVVLKYNSHEIKF